LNSPSDSPSADSSPSKAKGRSAGGHSLTPVTIKQLGQAVQFGEVFKVDGIELNMITIVGAIVRENQTTTYRNYEVDDGTGVIQVRIWIESDDSSDHIARQLSNVGIGKYVRAVGQLSHMNSERSMVAFRIIPITDFNEVTFHHLEVIQVHLSRTRGHIVSQNDGSYSGNFTSSNTNYNKGQFVSGTAPQGGNFTDVQRGILGILRENQNRQEGVPVQHVLNTLNSTFEDKDILGALDFLMNEGHIYTGIDDMHVKASQLD